MEVALLPVVLGILPEIGVLQELLLNRIYFALSREKPPLRFVISKNGLTFKNLLLIYAFLDLFVSE